MTNHALRALILAVCAIICYPQAVEACEDPSTDRGGLLSPDPACAGLPATFQECLQLLPGQELDRCGDPPAGFWNNQHLGAWLNRVEYLSDGQGDVIALRGFHSPTWGSGGWQCKAVPHLDDDQLYYYEGSHGWTEGSKSGRRFNSGMPEATPPFCDNRKFAPPSRGLSRESVGEVAIEAVTPLLEEQQEAMRQAQRQFEERQAHEQDERDRQIEEDRAAQRRRDEEQDRLHEQDRQRQLVKDEAQDIDRENLWVAIGGEINERERLSGRFAQLARLVYGRRFHIEVAYDVRGGLIETVLEDHEALGDGVNCAEDEDLCAPWHGTNIVRPVRHGLTIRVGGVFGLTGRVGLSVSAGGSFLISSRGFGLEAGVGMPIQIVKGLFLEPKVALTMDATDTFRSTAGLNSRLISIGVTPGGRVSYVFGKNTWHVRPGIFAEFGWALGTKTVGHGLKAQLDSYPVFRAGAEAYF